MRFNVDHLRAFGEVLAKGSFSAAAASLRVTQPAISQKIRALETQFGIQLIERIGRRVSPTPAGRELLAFARRFEREAAEIFSRLGQYKAGNVGCVRIAAAPSLAAYLLPRAIRALRSSHPGIDVIVTSSTTPKMLDALDNHEIDLAFLPLPTFTLRRPLVVEELISDPLVAVLPSGPAPRVLRAADFAEAPLIGWGREGETRAVIDAWFVRSNVRPIVAMELGPPGAHVEIVKGLVGAGLGRSIVPLLAAGDHRQRGVIIRPLRPKLSRKIGLAYRRDRKLAAIMRATLAVFAQLRASPPEIFA